MKSTDSKKKDYIPIKKYVWLYVVLFFAAILTFWDHLNESPLSVDQIRAGEAATLTKSEAGYIAPDFTIKNLAGKRDSLLNYKGQVVILNVWATWCGPCRIEMPSLETLYRRYRSEGVAVLAISIDKGADTAVKSFVTEYKLSFPVLMDSDGQVEKLYPAFSVPMTYVIDKKGLIVAKVSGAKNWESRETFESIEYLLKRG